MFAKDDDVSRHVHRQHPNTACNKKAIEEIMHRKQAEVLFYLDRAACQKFESVLLPNSVLPALDKPSSKQVRSIVQAASQTAKEKQMQLLRIVQAELYHAPHTLAHTLPRQEEAKPKVQQGDDTHAAMNKTKSQYMRSVTTSSKGKGKGDSDGPDAQSPFAGAHIRSVCSGGSCVCISLCCLPRARPTHTHTHTHTHQHAHTHQHTHASTDVQTQKVPPSSLFCIQFTSR